MDKRSKIFFVVFSILVMASFLAVYYRVFVQKNYFIETEASCDPTQEMCFVHECDPLVEECSENPEENTSYYKLLHRNAKNIPLCNPAEEGCSALECQKDEVDCVVTFCDSASEETLCSNPETYHSTSNEPQIEVQEESLEPDK